MIHVQKEIVATMLESGFFFWHTLHFDLLPEKESQTFSQNESQGKYMCATTQ